MVSKTLKMNHVIVINGIKSNLILIDVPSYNCNQYLYHEIDANGSHIKQHAFKTPLEHMKGKFFTNGFLYDNS